jgi:anti-sigma factor RsiW
MRCSSCEPLLDRYLEGTLAPREMSAISSHLNECGACARLIEEVKVVDALLLTTSVPELPANFTFAVMAETRSLPAPKPHRQRVWSFIAIYLAAAWVAAVAIFLGTGASLSKLGSALAMGFERISSDLSAAASGVGHGAPALATFSLGVLGIDLALASLAAILYVVIRPRLAAHLASVSEGQ